MIRLLKTLLTLFVGLMCIIFALQNIFNLGPAFLFVETMTSMVGHEAYPNSISPAVTSPALIWAILWIIIISELAAGGLALKGFVDMWGARNADADAFHNAKKFGIAGALFGVMIWFGYFHVIGGAFFQMWQSPMGQGPMTGSFQYTMMCGLVALLLTHKDD